MHRGFSLIQISILLTVASLVLVVILPSAQTRTTSDKITGTTLNAIVQGLRQYEAANGRLPCPADASQPTGSTLYTVGAANPGPSTNCSGGSPAANYVDSVNHIATGMVPACHRQLENPHFAALENSPGRGGLR